MAKKRQRKISNKPEDLPLTPMIDVVFQLMIYFVLTFKIPKSLADIPVFRPAPDAKPNKTSTPPKIRITVLRDGYLANERAANLETLKGWLSTLARLDAEQNIVINVVGGSDHKMLMDLLNVCKEVQLKNFAIFSVD